MHKPKLQGFTLVELAIVLVIIGLLVGGIMVGQDMAKAAIARSTIKQKAQFDTAVSQFYTAYNCLPGDCANGAQIGTYTGSGKGTFPNTCGSAGNNDEYRWFWRDLSTKGLIGAAFPGNTNMAQNGCAGYYPGWDSPTCPSCIMVSATASSGGISGQTIQIGGWAVKNFATYPASLGCSNSAPTPAPQMTASWYWQLSQSGNIGGGLYPILTARSAALMDAKIDDGKPLTGGFVAVGVSTYSNAGCAGTNQLYAPTNASFNYVNTTTNSYITTSDLPGVDANWRADFGIP